MMVMAVDPGKMTGIAWTTDDGGMASCQLEFYRAVLFMHQSLEFGNIDLLIVENFIPRRNAALTWQPDALHVIGALRYLAAYYNTDFELKPPIPKPRQAGLERELRERDWWRPTEGGHENAARKHLLMRLQKEEIV